MSSSLPPLNLFNVFLAATPILVVLYLMVGRNWGGSKAGPAGWLAAVLVALIFYGAGGKLLLVAWGKSVLLALFVLYIIWMALLLYQTVNEAGVSLTDLGRNYGFSKSDYKWKAKYGGKEASDVKPLRGLETENRRLNVGR